MKAPFLTLMGPELRRAADGYGHAVYGIWPDGRLAYVNAAWTRMALDNGGERVLREWSIGRSVWEAVPEVLAPFYRELWDRALSTGVTQEHVYECSSPEQQRTFRMRIDALRGEALLIRNDLRVESPRVTVASAAHDEPYRRSDDRYVTICANCRRVRRADESRAWDWAPHLIAHPPERVTHGICPMCLELYYPEP